MTDQYQPDPQAAVDQRLTDRDTEQRCASCGKPFTEHIGIIGTCAALKESEAKCRHLEHTATLAKERADKASAQVEALTKERDALVKRAEWLKVKANVADHTTQSVKDDIEWCDAVEATGGKDFSAASALARAHKERNAAIARAERAEAQYQLMRDQIIKERLERDALKTALRKLHIKMYGSMPYPVERKCECADCLFKQELRALLGENGG